MPALNEKVRARHDTAIGHGEHRGVVAHADDRRRIRRQYRLDRRDQSELTELGDGNDSLRGTDSLLFTGRPYGSVTVTTTTVEGDMVQAYILVQTEVGKAADVALAIAEITGVTQADDVTGPYDVIVRAEADNVDDLGRLVVAQIQGVAGITRTLTCPIVHI
jgi:DNA-binding Lrp family transcriptional regulator